MVTLKALEVRHIGAVANLLDNVNVSKYLTARIPYPYSIEDAKWWVTIGSKEGINKAIEVDGIFVGVIGVTVGEFEKERSAEIGYWIGEPFWGNGIATEAVTQMTQYVFDTTNVVRLSAPVFSPNKASTRVLEKCGYLLEANLKKALYKNGKIFDAYLYANVRKEFID